MTQQYPAIRVKPVTPTKVRLRVLPALVPLETELQSTGSVIQWRVGQGSWHDLVNYTDIDATIALGTVTTLAPGSSATVTNVGTPQDAVFNFGLPRGDVGATGATGAQGDKGWSPQLVAEADGSRVVLKLSGYVGGAGTAPTTDVGKYLKSDGTFTATIGSAVDIRGATGATGAPGSNGTNGTNGSNGTNGVDGKFSGTETIKTAAYTALSTDVGKTIILNKATADTLSFSAAATLGSTWMAIVKNIGAGTWTLDPNSTETIDGALTKDLLPNQSLVVSSNGSALRTFFLSAVSTGRELLTAARTYYVRTDGSDSNNGLANTSGGAFLTVQKAVDTIIGTLDLGGQTVTISVADGTYSGAIIVNSRTVGGGLILIVGNTTTPGNVLFNYGSGNIVTVDNGATLQINGCKFTAANGNAVIVNNKATLYIGGNLDFGACASGFHLQANNGGHIIKAGTGVGYTISGAAAGHYYAANASFIDVAGMGTITVSGTPAITAFAKAEHLSDVRAFSNTYSGSATGQRYSATLNSVIDTNGGGANYFPGNSAGATGTGAQYA